MEDESGEGTHGVELCVGESETSNAETFKGASQAVEERAEEGSEPRDSPEGGRGRRGVEEAFLSSAGITDKDCTGSRMRVIKIPDNTMPSATAWWQRKIAAPPTPSPSLIDSIT